MLAVSLEGPTLKIYSRDNRAFFFRFAKTGECYAIQIRSGHSEQLTRCIHLRKGYRLPRHWPHDAIQRWSEKEFADKLTSAMRVAVLN